LTATATGFTGATSAPFDITGAPAVQLVFTVQPSNTAAGATITPAVEVTAVDALGNRATSFSGDVSVAIETNPAGGTLSGTTTVAAVEGVATFADLSIDRVGSGYTLAATATGLSGATSAPFAITTGTTGARLLAFTVQPSSATAGATITPAVQVTAQNDYGNTATNFTGPVTVAIGTNPAGGTLSGTITVAAVAGVATFADLSIDRSGTGYTLTATATALHGAWSAAFDITPTPLTHLPPGTP
jgi:hypothetical protein